MKGKPSDLWSLYAMHVLGLLSASDLHSYAVSNLKEPVDEALLGIAICNNDDTNCIVKAADVFFADHDMKALSMSDVLRVYAAHVAGLIVNADISPQAGADLIAKATENFPVADFHDLDTFRYASSEMQDRPEDRTIFEEAILKEAAEWNGRRMIPPK